MDKKDLRQIIFSSATYSLSSILGPLLILGVPAYFLDTLLGTRPIIMLVSVFIAFITTNVLLFKKVQQINHLIATKFPPKKVEQENSEENRFDQVGKKEEDHQETSSQV